MQSKKNHSTMKKICLGVVWVIKNFQHYLVGVSFEVLTNHTVYSG